MAGMKPAMTKGFVAKLAVGSVAGRQLPAHLKQTHVAQQFRPSLPHHHLGRKPRAGDRLRGRRLSARHPARRRRHPDLSRQAEARPVALHHAAQGAGPGAHPLRRVHRRGERRAGDHRHADRARDRQCRRALQGLRGHQGQVPPGSRRLHLSRRNTACAIGVASAVRPRARRHAAWRPAPSRAKWCPACACVARWCRSGRMPSTGALGIGPRSSATRSSAPTPRR